MTEGYTINHDAVTYLLNGRVPLPDMVPIYPELHRRAVAVKTRAILLAGKDTGKLAASISLIPMKVPGGWHFRVLADTRYAWWHHRGTKPHIIEGPVAFRAGGKKVVSSIVVHPGTKPNPFLTNALPAFFGLRDIRF